MESGAIYGQRYSEYPFMHLMLTSVSLVFGTSYKDSLAIAVAIPYNLVSLVFVFLAARRLFDERIGLVSAILLAVFPFHIIYGYVLIPFSYGVVYYTLCLYSFMAGSSAAHKFLMPIMLIALTFSHAVAPAIMLLTILGLSAGSLSYNWAVSRQFKTDFPFFLVFALIVSRLMYGLTQSMLSGVTDGVWIFIHNLAAFFQEKGALTTSPYAFGQASALELLNVLGFSLFLGLTIVGILDLLRRVGKGTVAGLVGACLVMIALVSLVTSLGMQNLVPERWFPFLGVLLVIPAAVGLAKLFSHPWPAITVSLVLVFFSLTNSMSNMDSPIYTRGTSVRYAFTLSELAAARTTYENSGKIIFDESYVGAFTELAFTSLVPQPSLTRPPEGGGVFLIRAYILHNAFYVGAGNYMGIMTLNKSGEAEIEKLVNRNAKIYDNGAVTGVYVPGESTLDLWKYHD